MKAKIIAAACHQGGVGKVASVVSIGGILASLGKNVSLAELHTQP